MPSSNGMNALCVNHACGMLELAGMTLIAMQQWHECTVLELACMTPNGKLTNSVVEVDRICLAQLGANLVSDTGACLTLQCPSDLSCASTVHATAHATQLHCVCC
jgi:hypothetical protein